MLHASLTELEPGTVLEHRFMKPEHLYQLQIVTSALADGPAVLKAVMLAVKFMRNGHDNVIRTPLREVIVEQVREVHYPARPTRLTAVFLSPSIEDARAFRDVTATEGARPHLYSCTIDGFEPFVADINFVMSVNVFAPIEEQLKVLTDEAHKYWSGARSENPILEALTPAGTVKIAARADW